MFLRSRLKSLTALITLSLLPWLIHMVYVLISVLGTPSLQLSIFVGVNLVITLILLALSWKPLKNHRLWVAFLPVLQGFLYSLSLLWFVRILSIESLGLNSLSWVAYAGSAIAMAGLMLGYLFRLPMPKLGSLMKRHSK
jgi:hypothetical protein